jgi:hypothetical protein
MKICEFREKHPGKFGRIVKKSRIETFQELARSLDEIRYIAATKYIIPDANPQERRLKEKRRLQPSHPTKLTSRTGALVRMLNRSNDKSSFGKKWVIGNKTMTLSTEALKGMVKVTSGFKGEKEEYVATLKLDITSTQGLARAMVLNKTDIEGKNYKTAWKPETKQTLAIRFKHDTPGIRGHRRPFITPAAEEVFVNTKRIFEKKWDSFKASGVD